MCTLVAGSYYAQEENQIQGSTLSIEKPINQIKEISEKRSKMEIEISAYPNPSQGKLFIEGETGSLVTLYSLEGTYVGTWSIGEDRLVEISDIPQGTFICTIIYQEIRTVKKIVVI